MSRVGDHDVGANCASTVVYNGVSPSTFARLTSAPLSSRNFASSKCPLLACGHERSGVICFVDLVDVGSAVYQRSCRIKLAVAGREVQGRKATHRTRPCAASGLGFCQRIVLRLGACLRAGTGLSSGGAGNFARFTSCERQRNIGATAEQLTNDCRSIRLLRQT